MTSLLLGRAGVLFPVPDKPRKRQGNLLASRTVDVTANGHLPERGPSFPFRAVEAV